MARTANYVKLDTRTARMRLKPRKEPYYHQIAPGLTLGYARRESSPGPWSRRELVAGDYRYNTIGVADDVAQADGRDVLTFEQALKKAGGAVALTGAKITVRIAVENYLKDLEARKGTAASTEVKQRAEKHIYEKLGAHRVDRLTKGQIEDWLAGLVRGDNPDDPDARRRSQDSANRILSILKAALNHAFADDANNVPSDRAWRRVKAFRSVGAARQDHFDATQIRTLIAKAATFDKCFANLLEAAYLTGARLGELTALDVRDFDADRAVILIRASTAGARKTGSRPVTLTDEAVRFFRRLTKNKLPTGVLLPRTDGDRWGKSEHHRPFKRAAALAELPSSASFYSLRHSYISRAIEAGMPLSLLAENCGTSLTMIQQNYAKVLAATRRETIQATAPKLRRVK